jgi:pullulanase
MALFRDQLILVREDDGGRVLESTSVQLPGALDDLYATAYTAPSLGPSFTGRGIGVGVWAPSAQRVVLCVDDGASAQSVPMRRDDRTGIWRATVPSRLRNRSYRFAVDVIVPGVGLVRNRVTDPYATALTANSARSVLLSLDDPRTMPPGWRAARRPTPLAAATDQVVYELHVRDFSASDATVRTDWRGRYLAFTDTSTAGMRHLRALQQAGVTDLHLLPVYDLATVPEVGCVTPSIPSAAPNAEAQQAAVSAVRERDCFNWGYDPLHYTVPEGSYATDANNPAIRIREFRAMVQSLHAVGLRVGMDVVYNHTFAAGQSSLAVLDRIVPGYYHRLDGDGGIARSTCCENTATEHPMMERLMIESAATWARHYRIDSFRFDLMGHQPRAGMLRLQTAVDRAAGRHVPLLGEGWNFGEVADGARFVQASQRSLMNSGIATFSDRARDAWRGGGCCDGREGLVANQGLLNGLGIAPNAVNAGRDQRADLLRSLDLARIGLAGTLRAVEFMASDGTPRSTSTTDYAGQPAGYAEQPSEVVNYVENHDNLTLFDVNALRLPSGTSRLQRARAQLLGIASVLFSQGIAYLHAGVDILRSKSLDRDSFDSGDWFNRLDWSYQTNGFGAGLPPAHRNRDDWPVMRSALGDTTIAPTPLEIAFTRDATRDLLRIRSSSTLFRLRTADDIRARLRFLPDSPQGIVAHLDGRDYPGARFREVLYFINLWGAPRVVPVSGTAGKPFMLHPVHRRADAADRLAQSASFNQLAGHFVIPPRTAVVFVIE